MKRHHLAILMATYNGAKYVRQQLDSLLAQTCQNFAIFISDDGSSDETLKIVEQYANQYPKKIFILTDPVLHKGAAGRFFWLLEQTDASYYMFCDQDDVWLPDKIERTSAKMYETEKSHPDIPIVVHTDLQVVDSNLKVIRPSLWKMMKLRPDLLSQANYIGINNGVTGCTMMINDRAKVQSLPLPPDAPMHDYWIAYIVSKNGLVAYLSQTTILYRQHGSNTLGAQYTKLNLRVFFSKLASFRSVYDKNNRLVRFFVKHGYGSPAKWWFYKFLYLIRR